MQNTSSSSSGPHASVRSSSSSSRSGGWFGQGQRSASGPHASAPAVSAPKLNLDLRRRREQLSSSAVFDLLKRFLPQVFPLARAQGRYVSVTFQVEPARQVRFQLSELGFSWNYELRCWQHPCGQFPVPTRQSARA